MKHDRSVTGKRKRVNPRLDTEIGGAAREAGLNPSQIQYDRDPQRREQGANRRSTCSLSDIKERSMTNFAADLR
jgi:hypothetical protein